MEKHLKEWFWLGYRYAQKGKKAKNDSFSISANHIAVFYGSSILIGYLMFFLNKSNWRKEHGEQERERAMGGRGSKEEWRFSSHSPSLWQRQPNGAEMISPLPFGSAAPNDAEDVTEEDEEDLPTTSLIFEFASNNNNN